MNTSNLKDQLTMYAAIAFGTAVAILGLPATINALVPDFTFILPPIVNVICGIAMAVSIVITQVLTGKNPNGTTKTPIQVDKINTEAEKTINIKP